MEKNSDNYINRKDKEAGFFGVKKSRSLMLLIAVVAIAVFTSGCIQMTEHIRVSPNADISYMKMSITTTPAIYSMITENFQTQGYSGFQDYIKSANPDVSYKEEWDDDEVTITAELEDGTWIPLENSKIKITDDGSTITYLDQTFLNEDGYSQNSYGTEMYSGLYDTMMKSVRINIYLEMPGEIIDTNAHYVEKNKAEWHLDGATIGITEIYAKSKKGFVLSPDMIFLGGCILFAVVMIALILGKRSKRKRDYYY